MSSQTTVVATAAAAALATGVLAYAVWFDYRRRTQTEFRRELRRNERRQHRLEKGQAQANAEAQKQAIKRAVDEAKEEGFPSSSEEKEQYFLEQVQTGEVLGADPSKGIEAALAFYKALKVYPTPADLINIYDNTVAKPILDILAEMIAYDGTVRVGGSPGSGVDVAEMMRQMGEMSELGGIPGVGLD
ncbi:mitochondrial outer membrane translocase complex, subunit Tom20 domain-containing protein [Lasiosphaeria miniovina]|uniref:Mitochondrial import receptor subunit TOM20 n=1 Tax=Lasiosphaeria miniovina TaxID=1954250 RepID=A0AA40AU62_9PEZI|nr:mitochondrial outer membrane translocase complex, subunit Tom20 domain-containing protein [Lasiosphaeria miniovina]KAK0722080.1 mitochondrial outer membrane translocase complex, subunit Tom20 domain-containing protein [Lasiosphaeria miniovina]